MRCVSVPILALAVFLTGTSAEPCAIFVPTTLNDVNAADVVVRGKIVEYRIVLDQAQRRQRKEMLARLPDMPVEMRNRLEQQKRFLGDYARFTIIVGEVLKGKAAKTLTATWDNSTFAEPQTMGAGDYIVALRNPTSPAPPLRGPSATVVPSPDPNSLTVLQAPCSGAFIFEAPSKQATEIREILAKPRLSFDSRGTNPA